MFDRIYKRGHALARYRNGPLAEERLRYLTHCAEQQKSWFTLQHIAYYTLLIAKSLRLAERAGELITRAEIVAEAERWVKRRRARKVQNVRVACRRFTGHAIGWLKFLGRLQPPAAVRSPYADQVARFAEYMAHERGLSSRTIAFTRYAICKLLAQVDEAGLRLRNLTAGQVNDLLAMNTHERGIARVTVKRQASALRSFFRFAECQAWCRSGLADAIKSLRVYTHEGLPLSLSWADVKRLIASAKGGEPVDIRDRALLLLLAVYGLRAGEVSGLRLENFDWEREVLTVAHGKQQRPRTYRLCRSVGDAVLRYLREVRPRSDRREVFLTVLAPYRPMKSATVGTMVDRRLHALGFTLSHYGAHMLRHACASHLLTRGLSLKEIGDHLGHRSAQATRIYAKVDLAALRIVGDFNLEGLL